MSSRVLVVGSFPPIPLPAAQASVAALRQAWDEGREATVVSPRVSAADLAVRISGPFAAVRLERMRRLTHADRVVLVIEAGYPFAGASPSAGRWGPGRDAVQYLYAFGLARALHRFEHAAVVKVGDPGVPAWVLAPVLAAAQDVSNHPDGSAPAGVTPLGPAESTPAERPVELAEKVARRVLGRRAGSARRVAGSIRRRLRAGGRPPS